jgi:hypothetical protein
LFCAFDVDAKRFRFDRSEPVHRSPNSASEASLENLKKIVQGGGKYAETPTRVVNWHAEVPKYVRYYPVGLPRRQIAIRAYAFDPRILGLANWITVFHDYPPDRIVPAMREWLDVSPPAVTELRPGVTRVRWFKKNYGVEVDFDRAVGYMPIRYRDILPTDNGKLGEPIDSAVTTWQARDGVYVPVTARFQEGTDNAPDLRRYDLKLTWDVVNGPVDESLFTARGLGLPKDTLIVDNTTSNVGDRLGKVGDLSPDPKLAVVENTPVRSPHAPPEAPPTRHWLWPAVGAAVAVIVVALFIWQVRNRRAT